MLALLLLRDNSIRDLSPIAGITNLTDLHLEGNEITDLSPLAGLTRLTELSLPNNQISDVAALAGLKQLTELELQANKISDIRPLAGLKQLERLILERNEISDLSPLAGLVNLEELYLEGNPITDTTPLQTLLEKNPNVEIGINPATEWMPDPSLRILVRWTLNLASDASLTQGALKELTGLSLYRNQRPQGITTIKDLTGLEHATELRNLDIQSNEISDLTPLAGLTNLTTLISRRK